MEFSFVSAITVMFCSIMARAVDNYIHLEIFVC